MRISVRSAVSVVVCAASVAALAAHADALRNDRTVATQRQQDMQTETPLPAADLILVNGRVLTLENLMPEAQAIAIRDDAIYWVGTNADVRKRVGPSTQVIDLHGQLAIPGFIESHGHFTGVGEMKEDLDLTKAKSWTDIVTMVGEAAKTAKPGEWIRAEAGTRKNGRPSRILTSRDFRRTRRSTVCRRTTRWC